jgi:hypothetical protein
MWRLMVGFGMILFSLGTLAGLGLIVMLVIDREYDPLPRVAFGTVMFAGVAWRCRRRWQLEQQAREFRRENARERT